MDNLCEFGKWLYGLPQDIRGNPFWGDVQKKHAEFHKEAARVLALAVTGKKAEAEAAIEFGEKFMSLSGSLAETLDRWKSSLV